MTVDDIPDRFKHLLLEPVVDHINEDHTITSPVEQIKSPQSPISDEGKHNRSFNLFYQSIISSLIQSKDKQNINNLLKWRQFIFHN